MTGNADCVQHLLEAGASVRAENGRGQSALHLGALAQSPETLELLLSKGETLSMVSSGDNLVIIRS